MKVIENGEMKMSSRLETELRVWRYTLERNKPLAKEVIERVARKVSGSSTTDPFYYNRSLSRLEQGVETPQDYGVDY